MRVNVVHIRPKTNPHADGLREVAETLFYAASALGHNATLRQNDFDLHAVNIVVGWHLISPTVLHRTAANHRVVLYNLEQLTGSALVERFTATSWSCRLWDYSSRNIEAVRGCDAKEAPLLVPLGHVPEMTRIRVDEPLIDVLFYGSLNPRREAVLNELRAKGLEVAHLFGVYGQKRDDYLSHAKVVLNMHHYPDQIFEVVRCSYAWSNRIAVVSERNDPSDKTFDGYAHFAPYDGLVDACVHLVNDDSARQQQATSGYESWTTHAMADYLKAALSTL